MAFGVKSCIGGAGPMTAHNAVLDAKGLKCPLPVLRARKAMQPLQDGGVLRIEATDPGAVGDFVHFCEATGHKLVEQSREGDVYVFLIRKSG
jgi:tRNA 2-thiouridine synthesizing protein A